jgi:hypothetical protein
MSTRRNFRGIVYGVLHAFISRNNDVNGFWAMGKLCNLMAANQWKPVRINLRSGEMNPASGEFNIMIRRYADLLFEHMEIAKLPDTYLKSAHIELSQSSLQPFFGRGDLSCKIHCLLRLTDDRDRTYICEGVVSCRKHNPEMESRSTRIYE